MDWLDALQWPAMAVTVLATWLVGSSAAGRRKAGFWLFLFSNALWVGWGLHTSAWALVVLQFALAALNLRGQAKAEREQKDRDHTAGAAPGP
ncbi:hypothetical protein [Cupriavidus agavae]|uniref:Amino acid transporter n=1 Tax=Cupriavidus agavae TaxID=1001822 RepID=A0A4Q7S760_9BURK|nr:hypothetical protein [Cupriavidus agavae]RZT42185.1 hypothetical protein EV147_1208 [Cupriavidus agavae]